MRSPATAGPAPGRHPVSSGARDTPAGGRVRLTDIARQAQVSEATVSRVLNDRSGVSPDTRRAVLTALDVLGFERPDRLRKRGTELVGLVTPELENPVFPLFAQAIESALAQHGATAVLCSRTAGGVSEDQYVEMLLERAVAGIIFVSGRHADSTSSPQRYRDLVDRSLPIVLINGYLPGVDAPFVSCDDRAASRLAVSHLVSLGHRRIGLLSGPERFVPVQRKLAGYREQMRAHGLAELVELSMWFTVEGGHAAATRLLDRGATGLVCASDLMALGAVRAAQAAGLSVPRDVSVVGFDDSPLIPFTNPPLTTVRQPVIDMSNAAVRAMIDEIRGQGLPPAEYLFGPELVVRGSTGVPRAADRG